MSEDEAVYTIFVEPAESGANWGAWLPDLGVYATGETREDAIEAARSAASFHVAGLREDGLPIPPPLAGADRAVVAAY